MKQLTDDQIEMIADLFAKSELVLIDTNKDMPEDKIEWILGHAFIKGMKFYRAFTKDEQ